MTEEKRRELLDKANKLPLCPGVYLMHDKTGKVIYVGKSRHLKNRVSQYFQNSEKNLKTSRMVSNVDFFDTFLCDTEIEALSLENTLIKQYTPKYNILLKDSKSYPYIKLTNEPYPRLQVCRQREDDKAKYFGPYSGASVAYSMIDYVNKTLGLPDCKYNFPEKIGKIRPCINYQMHTCVGVCKGCVTTEEYAQKLPLVQSLLNGKSNDVKAQIEKEMMDSAEHEQFENAARCRDILYALSKMTQKQKVLANPSTNEDVIALYSDDFSSSISIFQLREGKLQDKKEYMFGADSILEEDDMTSFLCEYYKNTTDIPPILQLDFALSEEDLSLLSGYLSDLAKRKVNIHIPQKGEKKTLCQMVYKNAEEKAGEYKRENERKDTVLFKLAEILQLEEYPERIESYDISNFGQECLTAGMVVVEDGKFNKKDYRYFRIQSVDGTDDYGSMREALSRRIAHLQDEDGSFSKRPSLILLDGGRGHVATIKELFQEKGIDIPVFGMVKDDYHKTRALCTENGEISIAKEQDLFIFLYKLQEEVHRFTIGSMESAKTKTVRTSVLEKIEGIGEKKAKTLLKAFGGLAKVKEATKEQLAEVKGISQKDAEKIHSYYHKEETTDN